MKKIFLIFAILIFILLMISCESKTNVLNISEITDEEYTVTIGNPTPGEILKNDKNADIFLLDGVVYENAENIEWVRELDLTLGNELGGIKKNTNDSNEFENYTATKLPIGTVIYTPIEKKGPILIVIVDNKQIRYLGLIEG